MKKSKKIVLGLAFLIVFGLLFNIVLPKAKAMTVEEILAKIAQLQQQIAQLQKQLSAIQEPAVWCHNFNRNLRYGDAGPEVKALQIALEKEGFYKMEPNQPSYFDEKVASAVTGFQEKYRNEILTPWGLKYGTGFVGRTTRAKLNALYGCGVVQKSECQRNGGVCINFLAECKEGYQESSFSCKYKNEKCCVPVKKSIKVISPNGGEKWVQGNTYLIKWQVKGIRENLNIYLYREYGDNKRSLTLIAGGLSPEVTHYSWTIPSYQPTEGKYKISVRTESYGGMFSPHTEGFEDESDGYFSIVAQEVSECTDSDGGKDYYTKGTVTDEGKTYADYCIDSSTLREYFCLEKTAGGLGGVAEEDYACPYGCESGACKPGITVLSPNGGEEWSFGTLQTITWSSKGIDKVNIYLWFPDGATCLLTKDIPAANESYTLTIQENQQCSNIEKQITPGQYKIAIWSEEPAMDIAAPHDYSDSYFSIGKQKSITILSPNGGEEWFLGSTYEIKWNSSGFEKVHIDIIDGSKNTAYTLASELPASKGKFSWKIGSQWPELSAGDKYKIRVISYPFPASGEWEEGVNYDVSDNYFSISQPVKGITVLSPNGGEEWKIGNTYTIKWDSSGYDSSASVQIGLRDTRYDPNLAEGEAAIVNTTNTGSYTWTIPSEIGVMKLGAGNVYKVVIYIEEGGIPQKYDVSDSLFSIKKGITVLQPNGGEIWEKGDAAAIENIDHRAMIKWKVNGIFAEDTNFAVIKLKKGNEVVRVIGAVPIYPPWDSPDHSWQIWSVPQDIEPGDNYKIEIIPVISETSGQWSTDMKEVVGGIGDESDNYFSIVTQVQEVSSVGLKEIENQLAFISQVISRLAEQIKELLKR